MFDIPSEVPPFIVSQARMIGLLRGVMFDIPSEVPPFTVHCCVLCDAT